MDHDCDSVALSITEYRFARGVASVGNSVCVGKNSELHGVGCLFPLWGLRNRPSACGQCSFYRGSLVQRESGTETTQLVGLIPRHSLQSGDETTNMIVENGANYFLSRNLDCYSSHLKLYLHQWYG